MKAAAERSVDASLRLDQLQEVFGVQELDRAERARIQTALQMAGLEPVPSLLEAAARGGPRFHPAWKRPWRDPSPSLLEAEPGEAIRFGASKTAVAAGGATASP